MKILQNFWLKVLTCNFSSKISNFLYNIVKYSKQTNMIVQWARRILKCTMDDVYAEFTYFSRRLNFVIELNKFCTVTNLNVIIWLNREILPNFPAIYHRLSICQELKFDVIHLLQNPHHVFNSLIKRGSISLNSADGSNIQEMLKFIC